MRLAKLETLKAKGYPKSAIRTMLSEEFNVTPRTINRDFRDRAKWQGINTAGILRETLSSYDFLIDKVSMKLATETFPTQYIEQGWHHVLAKLEKQRTDIVGLPDGSRLEDQSIKEIKVSWLKPTQPR